MKRKRAYAILEVLIALSLLAICIVPLIREPISQIKSAIRLVEKVESEKASLLLFAQVKENLLNKTLSWNQIPKLGIESPLRKGMDIELNLFPFTSKKISSSYTLKTLREKQDKNCTYRLISIKTIVGSYQFTYRINVFYEHEPL
jgi:hypothetical protein